MSGQNEVNADALTIGPALMFERLWKESGIKACIKKLLIGRQYEFDVERAIFLTVLHRLMVSRSDRYCARWKRDYLIHVTQDLQLHHLYRVMSSLGQRLLCQ